VIRHHSLDHSGLEFPGQGHGDGLGASPGFISVIGGLLPMAPCVRSSLLCLRQRSSDSKGAMQKT
jgi:hypothetical protein